MSSLEITDDIYTILNTYNNVGSYSLYDIVIPCIGLRTVLGQVGIPHIKNIVTNERYLYFLVKLIAYS